MFAPQVAKSRRGQVDGPAASAKPRMGQTVVGNRAMLRIISAPAQAGRHNAAAGTPLQAETDGNGPADSIFLRRQPASAAPPPAAPEQTTTRARFSGNMQSELASQLVELADKKVVDLASYKKAILASGVSQKRYVYTNTYLLERLVQTLPLATYDRCINLLAPDARGRALAAMARIKQKYGLAEVSEDGTTWTEWELTAVDGQFSRMPPDQLSMLHDVYLIRKDKFPKEIIAGKEFTMNAYTSGGSTIQLTRGAIDDRLSVLHEVGHLIQQKLPQVGLQTLDRSATFADVQTKNQKLKDATMAANSSGPPTLEFARAMDSVSRALKAVIDSPPESLQDRIDQVNMAEGEADSVRSNEHSPLALAAYDCLKEYANAVERWATEKQQVQDVPSQVLAKFVSIVKAHNLDDPRKGFRPFNSYVRAKWPNKPQEFLVQSYSTWRNDPGYLHDAAPALFEWFKQGGFVGTSVK